MSGGKNMADRVLSILGRLFGWVLSAMIVVLLVALCLAFVVLMIPMAVIMIAVWIVVGLPMYCMFWLIGEVVNRIMEKSSESEEGKL